MSLLTVVYTLSLLYRNSVLPKTSIFVEMCHLNATYKKGLKNVFINTTVLSPNTTLISGSFVGVVIMAYTIVM